MQSGETFELGIIFSPGKVFYVFVNEFLMAMFIP